MEDQDYLDPRLDPNSDDFVWQALSDRNEDFIEDFVSDEWRDRMDSEAQFEQDFLTRPESLVAAEFVRDRERGAITFGLGSTRGSRQEDLDLSAYLAGNGLA